MRNVVRAPRFEGQVLLDKQCAFVDSRVVTACQLQASRGVGHHNLVKAGGAEAMPASDVL